MPKIRSGHAAAATPCRSDAQASAHRLLALCASLSLALAGCALPPTHRAAAGAPVLADLPTAWHAATPSAADVAPTTPAQWWQRFQDPDLAALVARAMNANTTVLGAQAALRQARALRAEAVAGLQPSLGSTASAQHGTRGHDSAGNSFQLGLDASWEVDLFGARRAAVDSSVASERASAASLGDVQVSIAAEVALDVITLRSTQARLAVAQANLESQLQTLQITNWRAQAGLLSTLEVEQARAASAQTRAQLPALRTSIEQTAHALAVLTGQAPAALADWVAKPGALPQAPGDLALSLPAETLRQRPDVRAAEQQVLAAAGRVTQADAARYPSFKLDGSLGLNALTLGALGHPAALATTLLASVSWPVWDGGAGQARVQAQQAALDQAQAVYRGVVLTALKDVEDALVALRGDRERQARLEEAAGAATLAARLARQRYEGGLVDLQTVLETQRTQLSTQDSLASATADVSADHVRLFKALGGGWQPDAALDLRLSTEPVSKLP